MAGSDGQQRGNKQEKQNKQGRGSQGDGQGAGVPLNADEQAKARRLEGQIKEIEQRIEGLSNTELRNIAAKLETVERSVLLEKIDNELHTIKDAIVKPGDAASTAAAGSAAAAAVTLNE